jgi:poly(hydroxyalkanoate) granule-associated protein
MPLHHETKIVEKQIHEAWLIGLGTLSTLQERGNSLYRSLLTKGTEVEAHGNEILTDKLRQMKVSTNNNLEKLEYIIEARISEVLHHLGMANKNDIRNLYHKVDSLGRSIEELLHLKSSQSKSNTPPLENPL